MDRIKANQQKFQPAITVEGHDLGSYLVLCVYFKQRRFSAVQHSRIEQRDLTLFLSFVRCWFSVSLLLRFGLSAKVLSFLEFSVYFRLLFLMVRFRTYNAQKAFPNKFFNF